MTLWMITHYKQCFVIELIEAIDLVFFWLKQHQILYLIKEKDYQTSEHA